MASVTFRSIESSRGSRKPRLIATRKFPLLGERTKRLLLVAAFSIGSFAAVEGTFRAIEYRADCPIDAARRVATSRFVAGSVVHGRTVNSHGYWDDEFTAATTRPNKFRIALL